MDLAAPQWFLLIPIIGIIGWKWPALRLHHPLRFLCLLLLVLLLVDPRAGRLLPGMDLWVLLDRSASAKEQTDASWGEWESLLRAAKPSSASRLRILPFASLAQEQRSARQEPGSGDDQQSRLPLAIQTALASRNPDKPTRLLAFTDGFATESLAELAPALSESGVALDYRLLRPSSQRDLRLTRVQLPSRVRPGEPFLLNIEVQGDEEGNFPILIRRNGKEAFRKPITIQDGAGSIRLSTRLFEPGSHLFEAELLVEDAYPGNNRFSSWMDVTGGPRILLITPYENDPISPILQAQAFALTTVTKPKDLHPGLLQGCRAVLFHNQPAYHVPTPFLEALDFFVREQGGGLLMIGGKQSFGSGGYFESAIDALLPVSMEQKQEERKRAIAMGIVMDRSGSMGSTVPGGQTKMNLANEGTARAVELLGEWDQVTIHAVDTKAHEQVPLLNVGEHRGSILRRVRRIGTGGGGIYVHQGLSASWQNLQRSPLEVRHLILFSDASDSEEPGDYQRLLAQMRAENTTVSVIGLGEDTDPDADLLRDIATQGGGRIFFTQDANTLPNIFAQETVTVARSLFLEEPTPTKATGQWLEIAPKAIPWLSAVDGYNLSYARPEATVALRSHDSYAAPLVSFVQRGLGRAAAIAFPLGGDFSAQTRGWDAYGDFLQTLTRWLAGDTLPPGLALRHRLDGSELLIDLFLSEETDHQYLRQGFPRILLSEGSGRAEQRREITWERLAPGHFRTRTHLTPGLRTQGAVQIGSHALPFGPVTLGHLPEWNFDRQRIEELKSLSAQSGGKQRMNLAQAWEHPPHRQPRSLRPWLLTSFLVVFLLEVLATRIGWGFGTSDRLSSQNRVPRSAKHRKDVVDQATPSPSTAPPTQESEASQRRRRFSRAKR
ncbi:MAG: VWA domain-containing protein [Verrucomicrobiota bacterium]